MELYVFNPANAYGDWYVRYQVVDGEAHEVIESITDIKERMGIPLRESDRITVTTKSMRKNWEEIKVELMLEVAEGIFTNTQIATEYSPPDITQNDFRVLADLISTFRNNKDGRGSLLMKQLGLKAPFPETSALLYSGPGKLATIIKCINKGMTAGEAMKEHKWKDDPNFIQQYKRIAARHERGELLPRLEKLGIKLDFS
jgi:hypothetical protein